jgi:Phage integrase family
VTKAKLSKSITPHDLRHHYAAELLAAGESVVTVANRLRHNNANTVLKTYGHLVANQDDRTRQAINRLWAAPAAVKDVEDVGRVVGYPAATVSGAQGRAAKSSSGPRTGHRMDLADGASRVSL